MRSFLVFVVAAILSAGVAHAQVFGGFGAGAVSGSLSGTGAGTFAAGGNNSASLTTAGALHSAGNVTGAAAGAGFGVAVLPSGPGLGAIAAGPFAGAGSFSTSWNNGVSAGANIHTPGGTGAYVAGSGGLSGGGAVAGAGYGVLFALPILGPL